MESFLDRYLRTIVPESSIAHISRETVAFAAALDVVAATSPAVAKSILKEFTDQSGRIKLVAGENFTSPAVMLAMGNWLNDKSAEGVPGKRFYAGCENVDVIERYAIDRARELFGAQHAYVQPHSGLDANLIAFWAVLTARVEAPRLERLGVSRLDELGPEDWRSLRRDLGDQRLLAMSMEAGGHLSHGVRDNITGKLFDAYTYDASCADGRIDYDGVAASARRIRPLILLAGYSSHPRAVNFRIFREIATEVGATLMVDMAHFAGLVAGGALTGEYDPVPYADIVTTTTHKTLRGPRGGMILCGQEIAPRVDSGCPLVISAPIPQLMAAKAVALDEASRPAFRVYAGQVIQNAQALAQALVDSDIPVITGGTDNHLAVIDVRPLQLTGRQAERALSEVNLMCNRNVIPGDTNGRWLTSGLRFGTAALTTLGMGPDEMRGIADLIGLTLRATRPAGSSTSRFHLEPAIGALVREAASELVKKFPLYPGVDLLG